MSEATSYNIYRNNVTVSLIQALAAVFPAVQRITGNEFLRAMARFHLRAFAPHFRYLFRCWRVDRSMAQHALLERLRRHLH